MALWHAAHSILTSYIPWNTSSPVPPLVVPGSQTRPPPPSPLTHPLFPSPAHPGGLSPGISGSHSQSVRTSRWVNVSIPASLLLVSAQIVPAVWSVQGRRTTPTRTLINPAEREPSALSMRDMGGKEKKVLMITNAPNYQGWVFYHSFERHLYVYQACYGGVLECLSSFI